MRATVSPGQRVVPLEDEPNALLIYDGIPDWVTLPEALGGTRANVRHGVNDLCPCKGHDTLVLVLDAKHNGLDIRVAECPKHGFLWHTKEDVR